MDQPVKGARVVHFEIIGNDTAMLRRYYGDLFGWEYGVGDAAVEEVSAPGQYGFVDGTTTEEGGAVGINGGIGGGPGYEHRVLFYVAVPSVAAALARAESLGGTRILGPEPSDGPFAVGRFVDPEGHLVGVAGGA